MRRIGIVVGAVSLITVASTGTSSGAPVPDTREQAPALSAAAQHVSLSRPLIAVSHRGASGYAPENTLAAIDAAQEHGARTVEIDVQLTADDEPVIMHDTTLSRTTDVEERFPDREPYRVGDFTLDEIETLDAGSWFDASFEGEPVPALDDALDLLEEHELNLFLELKEPALYPGVERLVAEELTGRGFWMRRTRPWEPRRLVVQSFDWDSVLASKRRMRTIPHALLGRVPEERVDEFRWAHMINPNHNSIDAAYVRHVQEAGLEIMPYTINEPDDMEAVLEMGVDGFITDYPDVGRQAIRDFLDERDPMTRVVAPPLQPA